MPSYCLGSRCIVLVGLFAAFHSGSPSASAQIRDDFITLTGNASFHVGVNPATNRIFTSSWGNGLDGIVTVIDGATNGIVATVAVGAVGEDIAANPVTNLIYVASYQTQTVAVIDGIDNTVIATVSIPDHPFTIAVNPVTNRVYIRGEQGVTVLDGFTNTVIATIPVGSGPFGLAVNPLTNRIFVSDASAGVVVINGATNTVIDTIPLDFGQPLGMAVNPVANLLYVSAEEEVKVVDTETLAVIAAVPVKGYARGVALNPSTNRLYVRTEFGGVPVIDTLTNTVVDTFVVSDAAATNVDIDVNPVTNAVYVPMAGVDLLWVAEDPAPVGGRDFGISVVSNGVQLTWTPGAMETGYSILRWAGNDGETLETIANLAQGRTSFVDEVALTEIPYHYALLPLDAADNPLWVSNIVGVWPSSQSAELAPTNFTLRHAAHGHHLGRIGFGVAMSWRAPGNQEGYFLAATYPDHSQAIPLPAEETRAMQVTDEPTCFMLYAGIGEEVGNTHALCAVPLTWAMNNDPSLARNLTSRTGWAKSTKSTKSTKSAKSAKSAKSTKPKTPTKRRG